MQGAHATSAARSAADDGPRTQRWRQMIGYLGQRMSRAADHDELAGAQQFFGLAPFGDIGEGVYTDEKKQAVGFFELTLQGADGVDRIMELLAGIRRFQQRGNKALVAGFGQRQRHHGVAMNESRERAAALVRRRVGGHEQDAIEPASIGGGAGDGEMAGVDRIEAAAEVADVHFSFPPQINADERGLMIKPAVSG